MRYRKYFEYSCTLNPDTLVRISYTDACTISTGQGTSKSAVTMMTAAATAATSDTQKLSLLHGTRCLLVCRQVFAGRRWCRRRDAHMRTCVLLLDLLAGGCLVCCSEGQSLEYDKFQQRAPTWSYDFRGQTSCFITKIIGPRLCTLLKPVYSTPFAHFRPRLFA